LLPGLAQPGRGNSGRQRFETQIEVSVEQIMLGVVQCRILARICAAIPSPGGIDRLEFARREHRRGAQRRIMQPGFPYFKERSAVDFVRSEYACRVLQGRSEIVYAIKAVAPERQLDVASDRVAIDGLKAEDRRAVWKAHCGSNRAAGAGSRIEAALKRIVSISTPPRAFTRSLSDRKPNGRTRRSYPWMSAAPYLRARSCAHCWRS